MSFFDAFARAYQMFAPDPAEMERRRQNQGYMTLMDMLNTQQADTQRAQTQNDLYGLAQKFASMNPAKPKYSFNDSLTEQRPTFDLGGQAPSIVPQEKPSLMSLVPKAAKPMPKYDDTEMFGAVGQALKKGVDASVAMPFLQSYYGKKRGEIDQKTLDTEADNLFSDLAASNSNDPGAKKKAMAAVIRYNRKAAAMGKPILDHGMMMQYISSDDMVYDEIKTAGPDGVTVVQGVMKPKAGGYVQGPDGKSVPYIPIGEPRRIGMSEEAVDASKARWEGLDLQRKGLAMRGGGGGGGRSGGGADAIFTRDEQQALIRAQATINAFNSRWKDPYSSELRAGHEKDPLFSAYQQAIMIENAIYGKRQQSGNDLPQVPNTGDPAIDKKIANMRAAGASEQLINDMVWEEQNKPQAPAAPKRETLDRSMLNWKY